METLCTLLRFIPGPICLPELRGGDPGFDPLEYMVRKTHEAGMQFHAWLNPLRIQSKGTPSILAPDHLYTQWREDSDPNNDDWVVDWEEGKYFNPAYPEVREKNYRGYPGDRGKLSGGCHPF